MNQKETSGKLQHKMAKKSSVNLITSNFVKQILVIIICGTALVILITVIAKYKNIFAN